MSKDISAFDPSQIDLEQRAGLPDALRELIRQYPRDGWEENPNYSGLIAFWLDKHLTFRRLTDHLTTDARAMLDGKDDPATYKRKLHRYGSMLIGDLHGHHQIEDAHYFPVMATLDDTTARGFDILDKDHQLMDGFLADLAQTANGVLQAEETPAKVTDATGAFLKSLGRFAPMLDRHLLDEEELVVPVLLKYAPPQFR